MSSTHLPQLVGLSLFAAGMTLASPASADVQMHVGAGQTYTTLAEAFAAIPQPPVDHHLILVHPGTYTGGVPCEGSTVHVCVQPSQTSELFTITVTAADPQLPPVFDGGRSVKKFFWLAHNPLPARATNLTFDGLVIQNYVTSGIELGGVDEPGGSSRNVIENNLFHHFAVEPYAGVVLRSSSYNYLDHNAFIYINGGFDNRRHAFDLAGVSTNNSVVRNTVWGSDSDPFVVREGVRNNLIDSNYVRNSARYSYVQSYSSTAGIHGFNTVVSRNTFVSVHGIAGSPPIGVVGCRTAAGWDGPNGCSDPDAFTVQANNLVFGHKPMSMSIRAIAVADFDGNGTMELSKATWTLARDGFPAHTVVDQRNPGRTLPFEDNYRRFWPELVYSSQAFQVDSMTTGDFDGNGVPEAVTAFWDGAKTRIYRGTGLPFSNGLTGLQRIYNGAGTSWRATAMTAGDYDGNGSDELIVVFDNGSMRRVCRSSAALLDELSPVEACRTLYMTTSWQITAITTGRHATAGEQVAIALKQGSHTRVYVGDGITSVMNLRNVYAAAVGENITALASVRNGGAQNELVAAFKLPNGRTQVWRGTGTTTGSLKNLGMREYFAAGFSITHLWAGDLQPGGSDEVVTVLQQDLPPGGPGPNVSEANWIYSGPADNLTSSLQFAWFNSYNADG